MMIAVDVPKIHLTLNGDKMVFNNLKQLNE